MPALLALIPVKDWIYGGIIVAILIGGTWYHHKLITEGVAEQVAADNKASATLVAHTAAQTAELKAKATMAEQAYDKEASDNAAYRSANPLQPVRLCNDSHGSGGILSAASAKNSGNANSSTAAGSVPPVHSGDSGSGNGAAPPDVSSLLDAFAGRADQVSAALREYQKR
jgi:hypothetical protein